MVWSLLRNILQTNVVLDQGQRLPGSALRPGLIIDDTMTPFSRQLSIVHSLCWVLRWSSATIIKQFWNAHSDDLDGRRLESKASGDVRRDGNTNERDERCTLSLLMSHSTVIPYQWCNNVVLLRIQKAFNPLPPFVSLLLVSSIRHLTTTSFVYADQ